MTNRIGLPGCLLLAAAALTFCSCKHLPPQTAAVPSGAGAAAAPSSAAGHAAAPSSAAAPLARRPPPAARPTPGAGETLAPVVPAPPSRPRTPQKSASVQFSPQPGQPGAVRPAGGAEPLAAHMTGGNPPAGLEYQWAPAAGCGPGCGPGCDLAKPHASRDEFLCDGGDVKQQVVVDGEFNVHNIDMTDTVGHYDTLDGQRLVTPSNRVCIYAPRFAAVRRIDTPLADDVLRSAAGMDRPLGLNSQEHHALVGSLLQPVQPEGQLGRLAANALLEQDRQLAYENIYAPHRAANPLPVWENFEIIQRGVYLNTEKPRLQEHVAAALTWMTSDSVEVMINQQRAQVVESEKRPQETLVYEMDGKPRLRICKVASTDHAQPGDTVDFTIRFDNIGDQKMGNVTILDSLTTRLEYVEDSQQCSVKADFFTIENEGQSLVLRWEVTDPLEVGEGGVIRFQCRVR